MKIIKKILTWVVIIIPAILCVSCCKSCYEYATYEATYEYKLQEIDGGIYGYYNTVNSNVPSGNYEVITLYFNGSTHTLDGNVNIHYTDSDPHLVWHYVRVVHGCTYDVYVPSGSIEMRPNVGLG